jgi:hypothetical protein
VTTDVRLCSYAADERSPPGGVKGVCPSDNANTYIWSSDNVACVYYWLVCENWKAYFSLVDRGPRGVQRDRFIRNHVSRFSSHPRCWEQSVPFVLRHLLFSCFEGLHLATCSVVEMDCTEWPGVECGAMWAGCSSPGVTGAVLLSRGGSLRDLRQPNSAQIRTAGVRCRHDTNTASTHITIILRQHGAAL